MAKEKSKKQTKEEAYAKVYQEVYSSCLNANHALTFVEVFGVLELVKISLADEMRSRAQSLIVQQPPSMVLPKVNDRSSDYIG